MGIATSAGTKLYIGPASSASTIAAFAALSYTEIRWVETIGDFGREKQDVTFSAVSGSDVQHLAGSGDYGVLPVTVAHDPLDPGQQALIAAAQSPFRFAYRLDIADQDGGETFYFLARVLGRRLNLGAASNVRRRTFPLAMSDTPIGVGSSPALLFDVPSNSQYIPLF